MGRFEGSKTERRLRRVGSIPTLSTSFMGVRDGRCVREGIVLPHLHQFCGTGARLEAVDRVRTSGLFHQFMLRHSGMKADTLRQGCGVETRG